MYLRGALPLTLSLSVVVVAVITEQVLTLMVAAAKQVHGLTGRLRVALILGKGRYRLRAQ
jgi:hypothetical protein